MQKRISNKKIMICACAAAAVAAVTVIALLFNNKEETFRSILVYDVEGNAVIERENVGAMNAAENLYLESGDRVSVASDSSMRMKLDDDKYVMAEADTIFSVEAEGTEADSRTKISLEQGAITNEIQNPLSEGSRFETSTPNAVMAVRGTIYRVERYTDENGGQNTKLCCFQGKVGAKPILSDGAYGKEILVPAGSELIIYQDGTAGDVRDIAYQELPLQAVINLLSLVESGQDVAGISPEELAQLTLTTGEIGETAESENGQTKQPETEQPVTAETDSESAADAQVHAGADAAKNAPAKSDAKDRKAPAIKPSAEQSAPEPQTPAIKPPKAAEPVNSGNVDNGNTGEEGSQDENTGNDSDEDQSDKDKEDKDKPSKPKNYTVTFRYQGKVFATQTVKQGETAAAPLLVPDENGAWDFDFGTKIQANTTITWK